MTGKYWQFSAGHFGFKPRHWQTPESIINDFLGYVELCSENPISKRVPRPLTVRGFCLFAQVSRNTYYRCLNSPQSEDIGFAIETVNDAIVNQKVELAVAGVYRDAIVTRLSGLSETITQHVTTKAEPCDLSALSETDLFQLQTILNKSSSEPCEEER